MAGRVVAGGNEAKFRILTAILLCWALGFGIAFHSRLGAYLMNYLHPDVVKALMVASVLTLLTVLIKKTSEILRAAFTRADQEISGAVSDVQQTVSGIAERNNEFSKDICFLKYKSDEHTRALNEVSASITAVDTKVERVISYNDETKMRYQSFEDDWALLRDDFEKVESDSVVRAARILKDCVRNFTVNACARSLEGDCDEVAAALIEGFDGHLDEFYGRASERLPKDFVSEYFFHRLGGARRFYQSKIEALCRGTSNGRRKKLTDSAHVFLFDALELLISFWTEYCKKAQPGGAVPSATSPITDMR